ncbi:MAG: hypothetical protein IOC90_15340 [Methylocystis sp.]|nr:hypothetical protein [Methylocystis sp.]MCA3589384.1 hypothetical protein [Methylocystis sp.]MCA3592666.1 hypothetical protein [Methylocystis sp.]
MSNAITMGEVVARTLADEMRRDPTIWVLGEDVQAGGIFAQYKGLFQEFGAARVVNTPIAESTIMGAGLGAALVGTRPVIEAAGALASQGIEADLLDLRTPWPWDREAVLASAARTGRALVVQEGVGASGFGAEVAATIAEHSAAKVRRLASPRIPVPFAPTLEEVCFMRPSMIVAAAKEMVAG